MTDIRIKERIDKEYKHIISKPLEDYQGDITTELVRETKYKDLTEYFNNLVEQYDYTNKMRKENALMRWIFTQKMYEQESKDPIFPYCNNYVNEGLQYELLRHGYTQDSVNEIMKKLNNYNNKIHKELSSVPKIKVQDILTKLDNNIVTLTVTFSDDDILRLKNLGINKGQFSETVTEEYYEKLENSYKYNSSSRRFLINQRIFILLKRYRTIGGFSYQAALPEQLFRYINKELKVKHECFASPLNRTLISYGSLFNDTDKWFKSKGSFIHLRDKFPKGGAFQANPPFIEETMYVFAKYILDWLNTEKEHPLMFIVFIPKWLDTPGYTKLVESKYLTNQIMLNKYDHKYRKGNIYLETNKSKVLVSFCDSIILVLQNDLAKDKWYFPIHEDNIIKYFS